MHALRHERPPERATTRPSQTATSPSHDLSEREREVLQFIAQGLSNADIAAKLFISEATVKSHVSSILGKLRLSDRTQAAIYAWRHGLMQSET